MSSPEPNTKDIFAEALRLTNPAERAAYLARACAGNPALRQDVESLLAAYDKAGDFLGQGCPLTALRALAASMMAREAPGQTLQPTAPVDEAWLRLFGSAKPHCPDRAYLFAALAKAMRRILVENARRKQRLKRGGNPERVDIESLELAAPLPDDELLAVDEALDRLAECEPFAAKLVTLCCFVGLTQKEAAKELGVSLATVERTWAFARAWLFREIQKSRNPPA